VGWPTLILAATLGFAYFNVRHKALVFIGDTGAIGLGYILGWLLIMLAAHGLFWAAALLALYYAADTGLTLILRLKRGEKVWQSARCHFYHQGSRPYAWRHLTACAFIVLLNAILIGFALAESWQIVPVSVSMGFGLALCGLFLYVFYKKGGSQIVVPHLN
jgi:UDP-N-acetylmuramyl pentapeptide phosphotransferase/UDP-N-acetylglucosamine-1-phosphate transferase